MTTTTRNARYGNSKTVHNLAAHSIERINGQVVWVPVPTCSVATVGKTRHETTDPVTCRSCLKHRS
jgi:hypothetical protein